MIDLLLPLRRPASLSRCHHCGTKAILVYERPGYATHYCHVCGWQRAYQPGAPDVEIPSALPAWDAGLSAEAIRDQYLRWGIPL